MITIKPKSRRRYRGKQARRAAFYNGCRMARLLTRLVRLMPDNANVMNDAFVDALVSGEAWIEVGTFTERAWRSLSGQTVRL